MYISQLIRFARASFSVSDFNCRNKALRQGYHKLCNTFSKFYRRHSVLVKNYNVSLTKLLQRELLEPEFYGNLVYRIRKIVGKSNFSEQFRKLVYRYKRIGYNPYIMRQAACLVMNTVMVASLFNCTAVLRASDSMAASS